MIMGEQPMDYFDTFVEEWYDQGGRELTREDQRGEFVIYARRII